MDFSQYFPIWNKLTDDQRQRITQRVVRREVKKGTLLHDGSNECTGLLLVRAGQLRAYILSDEGREITIQFDITVEAEKDTELWLIPPDVYQSVMNESAAVANYTNEVMASRFSEVMWLMEQIMWKSLDKRLAAFLAEEAAIEGSETLKLTHETIAKHLGSHREVITRMLRYFQSEGWVKVSRGTVEILDMDALEGLSE